jgi:hypothetical protein
MERKRAGRVRWVALGLTLGLVAAWGGFTVVEAATPSSITTCTKTSTGKMKVITASQVAKCQKRGKGSVTTWDDHAVVEANSFAAAIASATQLQQAADQLRDGCTQAYIIYNNVIPTSIAGWEAIDPACAGHTTP